MDDIFREPGTTGLEAITVRELRAGDLEAIVRIDAGTVGRRRPEYYQRKLAEAMRESGIKISLAAETEGMFAGFLLGRLYYGEFGLPEPIAIVDSIGVHPELKGRHVGRALFEQLETNLKAIGIETIQTQVEWNHFELLGFLKTLDFRPVPTLSLQKKLG
ncbi:MAG TPA: GNAT family N-acetyltransferase [Candidatus Polarisedimenticolia bacterium]|nr:GNAT family N-acetyltransferase [Candidatus Polarisedimenticolia bacterium]